MSQNISELVDTTLEDYDYGHQGGLNKSECVDFAYDMAQAAGCPPDQIPSRSCIEQSIDGPFNQLDTNHDGLLEGSELTVLFE